MPDEIENEVQEQQGSILDAETAGAFMLYSGNLFGRKKIETGVDEINRANLIRVLSRALAIHHKNAGEIDYLYDYMRGKQPILARHKKVRPEICNKVVENHAAEITQFTSGYFLGEPLTYVRRGDRQNTPVEIKTLNDFMFYEDKESHDKELADWMAIGGIGYRMSLPDKEVEDFEDDSPFELDTPDPRKTFVVYHSGFGHKPMMACQEIVKEKDDGSLEFLCCGYTKDYYFEVLNESSIRTWKPHSLGCIPIFEYRLNMMRMGSFEPAIPLLDAINNIMSNRIDGLEQFIQSFLKFVNCEIDDTAVEKLRKMGAIVIKSTNGQIADVQLVSQELNQEQTQCMVDYLYDQVLVICGMPTTTKGGKSTSDTGQAVFLRDGWSQCEARAKDTELLFKKSEKAFLRLVLHIIKENMEFNLKLSEVECKFTRRQHDNLLTKTQALTQMLQAGIAPEVAISTCGLFNDPMDVVAQSKPYLQKWEYKPMTAPVDETPEDDNDPEDDDA